MKDYIPHSVLINGLEVNARYSRDNVEMIWLPMRRRKNLWNTAICAMSGLAWSIQPGQILSLKWKAMGSSAVLQKADRAGKYREDNPGRAYSIIPCPRRKSSIAMPITPRQSAP